MNVQESRAAFAADVAAHERAGIIMGDACVSYTPEAWKRDFSLAMDAQPALLTTPSGAIPWFLTATIDPDIYRILYSPLEAAEILGEVKKGSWVDTTQLFPVIEQTGEVSSYGDYNNNGSAGVNIAWPMRQNYLFQTIVQYGELELERAGLAKINYVTELDASAALALAQFLNLSYFFGIAGLQSYGILNDPGLNAALTPATKAYGGVKWINSGVIVASANEVYADIQAMFYQLVVQTAGRVKANDELVLAMSPGSSVAMTTTNSFGVNVYDLLKKNFPNIKFMTGAVQYGAITAGNPNGVAAGNFVQLIAKTVAGQQTGYAAYSEKQRSHPIIKDLSSFKKKLSAGTWGAIMRFPGGVVAMVGV